MLEIHWAILLLPWAVLDFLIQVLVEATAGTDQEVVPGVVGSLERSIVVLKVVEDKVEDFEVEVVDRQLAMELISGRS